jgi:glycerol kinase
VCLDGAPQGTDTKLKPQKVRQSKPMCTLAGSIAITGPLVQGMRDNLGLIGKSSDIEMLTILVTDSGGVYFVPAFSG